MTEMTDQEAKIRIAIVVEHLSAFGLGGDQLRAEAMCGDTAPVPVGVLRPACQYARQTVVSSFPPTASQIIECAVVLSPREHDAGFQGKPSDQRPMWFVAMKRAHRKAARRTLTPAGKEITALVDKFLGNETKGEAK